MSGFRRGPQSLLSVFHRFDVAFDYRELFPDLIHLFLGHDQSLADLRPAGLLGFGFVLQRTDLFRPHFDLLLALDEELGHLFATTFHIGDTAVQHLDLLPTFGEFEPSLGQCIALHVTIGADLNDSHFHLINAFTSGCRFLFCLS